MPLRGAFAPSGGRMPLGSAPGLSLWVGDRADVDADATYALLCGPRVEVSAGAQATAREVYGGLILWLALHEPGFCWLEVQGAATDGNPVPRLFGQAGKFCSAAGVLEDTGACFLMRPPGASLPAERVANPPPFELFVRGLGDGAPIRRVLDRVADWDARGRPGTENLRIRAYPIGVRDSPSPDAIVVPTRWNRLVLDWPGHSGGLGPGAR